jgi:hypothetical protein
MGKFTKTENEKKLISAIKNGGKTWSELEKILPKKTVSRYLERFTDLGVIYQDSEDKRYYHISRRTIEKSPKYIEHSLNIVAELGKIPFVGINFNYAVTYSPPSFPDVKIDSLYHPKASIIISGAENEVMRKAALEHLKTGYHKLYDYEHKLEMMQPQLCEKLKERGIPIGSVVDPEDPVIKSLFDDYYRLRKEFAGKLAELKAQLSYAPSRLKGECFICHNE